MPRSGMARYEERLDLEEFERLLDAYGSNPDRWPVERRAAALACAAENRAAACALAEARALDVVLDRAPGPDLSRLQPLADRIMAAAAASGGTFGSTREPASGVQHTARVITLPVRKSSGVMDRTLPSEERLPVQSPGSASPRSRWQAATALAASLMLGIVIGVSDLAPTSMLGLDSVAEAHVGDAEVVLSALGNGLTALDEDEI